MQIHGPSSITDGSTFYTELNPASGGPFAHVQMGNVRFYADTPAECDAAIRVWSEAKRLLTAAQDAAADVAGDEVGEPIWCTSARNGIGCELPYGHNGSHYSPGTHRDLTWDDDGPAVIAGDSGPEQVTS